MIQPDKKILLSHGSGGTQSRRLIRDLFFHAFDNDILNTESDSALCTIPSENLAFTTDSFVVDPLFFPGADIGKLAVCGTVNDLSVSGAVPKYLSAAFIIEEGLDYEILEKVVYSMAETAKQAGIRIVTGDTKVVNRGKCDRLFITTTGIGELQPGYRPISTGAAIEPGDIILINGFIADHGCAVISARNELKVEANIESDCAPLNALIQQVLDAGIRVRFMRDATRGGLATVLAEMVQGRSFGAEIIEDEILLRESVRGMCEFFGFDPLYVANEGKVVMIVHPEDAEKAVSLMRKNAYGKHARIIGKVVYDHHGIAALQTRIGGRRIIDMIAGDQLPRIC
jgi:hydrogenase expression/formation protein HypE